jgi:peptide/nickel transport system permease protein
MSIGAPIVPQVPQQGPLAPFEMVDDTQPGRRRRLRVPAGVGTFFKNGKATFGFVLFGVIALAALFAPLMSHGDPSLFGTFPQRVHPGSAHWFGTNDYGQDIFALVVYGARISLLVATGAAAISTAIATCFGLLAAYKPGPVDGTVNMVTNIFLVIPGLPLLIVVMSFIPQRGPVVICILLGVTSWAIEARILRGQALGLRGRDFILAAKVTGESTWRIIFGEFVPNMISRIVAGFILTFNGAIFGEAALEFLGFNNPHQVTWGTMLFWAYQQNAVASNEWWVFVFPGLAISMTIVALIFLQYGVDELSNPKLRNQIALRRSRIGMLFGYLGSRRARAASEATA